MLIPKIIHQTWKDVYLPPGLRRLSDTWKACHPDWEYHLWTDEMNRDFVRSVFPEFLAKYDAYPSGIYRVDAVRYLILYKYGGIFTDMDFECFSNMESLLKDASCVFGLEPFEHCHIHEKDQIISNAFMAAISGHGFFRALYEELNNFSAEILHPNNRVLETTGPFMTTRVYKGFIAKESIRLLGPDLIYPLTKSEISRLLSMDKDIDRIMEKLNNAYALHYYYGTWWDKNRSIDREIPLPLENTLLKNALRQ